MNEVETYHGQRYVRVGLKAYTRRDGGKTVLVIWESHCADCGDTFRFNTPINASRFMPNRRCPKHKRPGQRVRGGKA